MPAAARAAVEALEDRRLLSTAGDLDPTYATGTVATVPSSSGVTSVDTRGGYTVVAAGTTLARLANGGVLDANFDGDGRRSLGNFANVADVFIQSDGKILAAGTLNDANHSAAVTRLNTNGTVDASFGAGGVRVLTQLAAVTSVRDEILAVIDPGAADMEGSGGDEEANGQRREGVFTSGEAGLDAGEQQ